MRVPIVRRFDGNPILTAKDIPYPVESVHNAAVVKHDGKYVMLFRSHRDNGRCILGLADSDDGFRFVARPEPFMVPIPDGVFGEYEAYGVEDPRICKIDQQAGGAGAEYGIIVRPGLHDTGNQQTIRCHFS